MSLLDFTEPELFAIRIEERTYRYLCANCGHFVKSKDMADYSDCKKCGKRNRLVRA